MTLPGYAAGPCLVMVTRSISFRNGNAGQFWTNDIDSENPALIRQRALDSIGGTTSRRARRAKALWPVWRLATGAKLGVMSGGIAVDTGPA